MKAGGPIKRIERIGGQTLILGDCLECMPLLGKFDCVVTDPPYKLTYGGCHGSLGGKLSEANYDNKGGIVACDLDWPDFMPKIYEALAENSHAYIMCNNRHIQNLLNSAEAAGLKFHNMLVWNKGTATPNRWYMKNLEFTGFFYKGRAFFINDCGSTQLHRIPNPTNEPHPTSKPSDLISVYVKNSTQAGQTVLDPFMGIGSSLVACEKLGRSGTGIELDEKFFDITCERVLKASEQPHFFPDISAPKPTQGGFL